MKIRTGVSCIGLLAATLAVKACKDSRSKVAPNPQINFIELVGRWDNTAGCTAEIVQVKDSLFLKTFSSASADRHFQQQEIIAWKEGIITKFKAVESDTKFSGIYTEGMLLIDHDCQQALHKVNGD